MVAVITVLIALILMSTISFNAAFALDSVYFVQNGSSFMENGSSSFMQKGPSSVQAYAAADDDTDGDDTSDDSDKTDSSSKEKAAAKAGNSKKQAVAKPQIEAGGAVVYSASTSELVYSLHEDRKLQPGKLGLLMTAMIVIDNMHSDKEYQTKIEITKAAAEKDKSLGAAGSTMSLYDLLEKMLINGSDAAAELLIDYSSSSTDIFVSEMNSKAIALGLLNTQFANGTGASNSSQYSSAYDCAVIAQYALRYEKIKQILTETKSDVEYDSIYGAMLSVLGDDGKDIQYLGIASEDDMELVVVMLNSVEKKRQDEAEALFEYGYDKVSRHSIVKAGKKVGKARVRNGAKTKVAAYTASKGYAYIPPEGSTNLVKTEAVLYDGLSAPLKAGDKVGEYRIYVADSLKGTVDIVVKEDVEKGWFLSKFYISNIATITIVLVVLFVIYIIFRILHLKRRKKKLRELRRRQKIREEARKRLEIEEDRRRRGWTIR